MARIKYYNEQTKTWDYADTGIDPTKVIDNLESADTLAALSANQGKILNETKANIENSVAIGATEPTTKENVWFQKGKNLFDKNKALVGQELFGDTGNTGNNGGWWTSDYIKINPNTTYINSGSESGFSKCIYDKDKNFLFAVRVGPNLPINIPNNPKAYYIRVNDTLATINKYQLEEASVATSYEAYIPKKILTKKSNGKFDEFYNEENINKKKLIMSDFKKAGIAFNLDVSRYKEIDVTIQLGQIVTEICVSLEKPTANVNKDGVLYEYGNSKIVGALDSNDFINRGNVVVSQDKKKILAYDFGYGLLSKYSFNSRDGGSYSGWGIIKIEGIL